MVISDDDIETETETETESESEIEIESEIESDEAAPRKGQRVIALQTPTRLSNHLRIKIVHCHCYKNQLISQKTTSTTTRRRLATLRWRLVAKDNR